MPLLLSSIAAISLLSAPQEGRTMLDGIWATRENEAYVFSGRQAFYMLEAGGMFGSLDFDRNPPDGSIWYAWSTGPKPEFVRRGSGRLPVLGEPGEYKVSGGGKLIRPSNQGTIGWFKYWPSPGTYPSGDLTVQNSAGNTFRTTKLTQIAASIESVWVDGYYKDNNVELNAKFVPGYLKGNLVYANKSYLFEGEFKAAGAFFRLVDYRSGSEMGSGFIQWAPTKEFVGKMRQGTFDATNRVLVWLKLSDRSTPNGYKAILTKQY